jgi:CheY-like chemotaxis protein
MHQAVMIAEDDECLCRVYCRVLESSGHDVLTVHNGSDAIDALAEFTPDVLFLDMMLPGINGDVVLEFIAQTPRLNRMRVVIVSSNASFGRFADGDQIHFQQKPIRPAQIRAFTGGVPA